MTRKPRAFIVLMALAVGLIVASAESHAVLWMNDSDLKATFEGKTIAGLYPSGRGFVETYHRGGRVAYQDQVRQVGGRWSRCQREHSARSMTVMLLAGVIPCAAWGRTALSFILVLVRNKTSAAQKNQRGRHKPGFQIAHRHV